ncbi:MAG: serine hydroxymethyltransferase [Pseudomonadota bacterium]
MIEIIEKVDPEIAGAIRLEFKRQTDRLDLIASENIASPAVMLAQATVFGNKYAEGYPDRRYYGGCEFIDIAEKLAIERACLLFNCSWANVQPHSGSQANMAVFFSFLSPNDTIMGMDLAHGGHLTHGSPASFSGKFFKTCFYGVDQRTGCIDYDAVAFLARKHSPKLIIAGASAYPRVLDFEAFRRISKEVGAYLFVDMAHIAGLVAAGVHPSPIPYADFVTSTTHKTLRGPRGGLILSNSEGFEKKINSEIFPGIQGGPLMHVIAAKAIAFKEALAPEFKDYQQQIVANAKALAEKLIASGLTLVSGGTDNHLMLVDLTSMNITGKEAEQALDRAGITVNKNAIPFDTLGPRITSGVRIGTPSITTRGMKEPEMETIAELIVHVLENVRDNRVINLAQERVRDLCSAFPLFPNSGYQL